MIFGNLRTKTKNDSEEKIFREEKKLMRLLAFAMASDNTIHEKERLIVEEIFLHDVFGRNIEKRDIGNIGKRDFEEMTRSCIVEGKLNLLDELEIVSTADEIDISLPRKGYKRVVRKEDSRIWRQFENQKRGQEWIREVAQRYARAGLYVEELVSRLTQEEGSEYLGLFVNVSALTSKFLHEELRDMMLVVKADGRVDEAERMCFLSVAKAMRVRNSDGIWDTLSKCSIDGLWGWGWEWDWYRNVEKKETLGLEDVEIIKETITSYQIKGPIRYGLRNALRRELNVHEKREGQRNHSYTAGALWVFVITAILLYFQCAMMIEEKIVQHEYGPFPVDVSPPVSIYIEQGLDLFCKENDTPDSVSSINEAYRWKLDKLDKAKEDKSKDQSYSIEVFKQELYRRAVEELEKGSDGDTKFYLIFVRGLPHAAGLWLGWLLIVALKKWLRRNLERRPNFNEKLFNRVGYGIFVVLAYALIVGVYKITNEVKLACLYNSILVLLLMLSIEVMIFMRGEYAERDHDDCSENKGRNKAETKVENKGSSALLIVLVTAAVITDLCIGFIELPRHYTTDLLFDKIASALLLGCLSFFSGKFLELSVMRQKMETRKMKYIVEEIDNRLMNDGTIK